MANDELKVANSVWDALRLKCHAHLGGDAPPTVGYVSLNCWIEVTKYNLYLNHETGQGSWAESSVWHRFCQKLRNKRKRAKQGLLVGRLYWTSNAGQSKDMVFPFRW